MLSSFFITFRETLECGLLIILLVGYPAISAGRRAVYMGAAAALFLAIALTLLPQINDLMPTIGHWINARYISEFVIFYTGAVLLSLHGSQGNHLSKKSPPLISLFALGFLLFFFEARALILYSIDISTIQGAIKVAPATLIGLCVGVLPIWLLQDRVGAARLEKFFSSGSLLVTIGAIKFIIGGVPEVEDGDILINMQQGLQQFVEGSVDLVQSLLLVSQHSFIDSPFSGLADYFREQRLSTALTLCVVMAPPVLVMMRVFSRPDPEVRGIDVAAERRLKVAFFRREMAYLSAPVIISLILLTVSLHAVNASVNPLSEPEPIPVMLSEDKVDHIVIPLVDRIGDFSDGKLRKYVYYTGKDKIVFLAIMKPDGTIGLALDECEICKPAEWNTAAIGYAQRGDHLVCKYCMSPIAIPSVNEPGGCNPVPVPYVIEKDNIALKIDDLIRIHELIKNMEKKGTHF